MIDAKPKPGPSVWKNATTPTAEALLNWTPPARRRSIAVQFEGIRFRTWRPPSTAYNQSWKPPLK